MERRTLLKLSLVAAGATFLKTMAQRALGAAEGGPGPASAPASPRTLRRPEQAEIIQDLLRQRDKAGVILPQDPQEGQSSGAVRAATADDSSLLPEGTILVERPGRLVSDGGRPLFVFLTSATGGRPQSTELLPRQLLEALERELARGSVIPASGEATRFPGRNYLPPLHWNGVG